jgi:hypothetical protein
VRIIVSVIKKARMYRREVRLGRLIAVKKSGAVDASTAPSFFFGKSPLALPVG